MRAIQPCALLREPVGTGTRSGNGKTNRLPWDGGWGRKRGVSGGESHLESTESVARERERITVKPRNQNAGEGGNLRGRGNSAGAGVLNDR